MRMKCKLALKFEGIIINNALFVTQLSSTKPAAVLGPGACRGGRWCWGGCADPHSKGRAGTSLFSPANARDKLPADKAPLASLRHAKYMDFCLFV